MARWTFLFHNRDKYARLGWTGCGLRANNVEKYVLFIAVLHVAVALERLVLSYDRVFHVLRYSSRVCDPQGRGLLEAQVISLTTRVRTLVHGAWQSYVCREPIMVFLLGTVVLFPVVQYSVYRRQDGHPCSATETVHPGPFCNDLPHVVAVGILLRFGATVSSARELASSAQASAWYWQNERRYHCSRRLVFRALSCIISLLLRQQRVVAASLEPSVAAAAERS